MADNRRGLLTPREREILSGEADVEDDYYYAVVSRVRGKIENVEEDAAILRENHSSLYSELRAAVSEDDPDEQMEGDHE
jgi:hypothetical protein